MLTETVVCSKRACDACVAAHRATETRQQREQENMGVRDRWDEAGLTESMYRQTLASFDGSRLAPRVDGSTALDDVAWVIEHIHDESAPWLLLWGQRGRGKTHLAIGLLLEVCRRGGRGLFRTGKELMDELRATHEPGSRTTEAELQRRWARLDLVVIDDVGTERLTPYTAEAYWAVIDGRYRNGLPLVLTTNATVDALMAHVGEAAASRIGERALMSEVAASDYRVLLRGKLPTPIHQGVMMGEPDDVPF